MAPAKCKIAKSCPQLQCTFQAPAPTHSTIWALPWFFRHIGLTASRLKPTSALARDVTSWERGRPARSLVQDRREDVGGGRPRSQDERPRPYPPPGPCHSN